MNEELDNALKIVLDDLEQNNNHTIGKLLFWAYYEEKLNNEQAEAVYRAWLLARDFIYYGKNGDNSEEIADYRLWLTMREQESA
jgi:hypothetical protein